MVAKLLLLIRHVESEKNVLPQFSHGDGREPVTPNGIRQGEALADAMRTLLRSGGGQTSRMAALHTADTQRSDASARLICQRLGCPKYEHTDLRPISSGRLGGLSEMEARVLAPDFTQALELYRAGVLSSYQIPGYGESVTAFEHRVGKCIDGICSRAEPVQIVVAHRSPITATLIRYARVSLGYPAGFYGHIPLDVASVSGLVLRGASIHWLGVNLRTEELAARIEPAMASIAWE